MGDATLTAQEKQQGGIHQPVDAARLVPNPTAGTAMEELAWIAPPHEALTELPCQVELKELKSTPRTRAAPL